MLFRKATPLALCLVLANALACASGGGTPGDRLDSSGGKADGPGSATTLARCWIEAGADAAASVDVLHCADDGASGATVQRVEIGLGDGSAETIDLARTGEGRATIPRGAYPLTLDLEARVDVIEGADAHEFWMKQTVESAEDLAAARAFFAPYDLWTIVVENQTPEGDVGFDAHVLFLEGADVPRSEDGTLSVPATNAILDAGQTRTFVIPVTRGTKLIHGTARDLSVTDALTPFSLEQPGRYLLTADGLFEAPDGASTSAPVPEDDAILRCGPFDVGGATHLTCHVVARPGVELSDATVTRDGDEVSLPVDGTVIDLGGLHESATLTAKVQLGSGIHGLSRNVGPVEGELVVNADGIGEKSLRLPFGLLHVEVTVEEGVRAAMFDGPNLHVVEFSRPWGGMDRSEYQLRARLGGPTDRNLWIAVSPGVSEIAGEVAVFETETPDRFPTTLVDGERWRVSPSGPVPD